MEHFPAIQAANREKRSILFQMFQPEATAKAAQFEDSD
jgi:hypothetical protein